MKTSPLSGSLLTTFVMIAGSPRNDFLMSLTPATRYIFAPGKLSTLSPRVRKRGTSEPPRRMTGGFEARAVRQNHLEDDQSVQRHARLLQCHGNERQIALTLADTLPSGVAFREFPLPPGAGVRGHAFSSAELCLRQAASALPRNDSPPVLFLFHRSLSPCSRPSCSCHVRTSFAGILYELGEFGQIVRSGHLQFNFYGNRDIPPSNDL